MPKLDGETIRYEISRDGRCCGLFSKPTGHQYVCRPDFIWRLIYAEGERTEIPVWSAGQEYNAEQTEDGFALIYPSLKGDSREIHVSMRLTFRQVHEGMLVDAYIENRDKTARIMELFLCPAAGVRTLAGQPEEEYIAWPAGLGMRVENPAFSDLSAYSGFRKYEKHDQYHTDLCNTYPARLCMQWYDWCRKGEGLYVGSHDTSHHTISLSCERDVKTNTLRMGVHYYPLLEPGESEQLSPIMIAPHLGDWHIGSKIYRRFILESGMYERHPAAEWAEDTAGWLRIILKQHHLECNWTYHDIPRLYDEAEAAGLNILYLLGWEKGGFARLWPDYVPDDGALGGAEELKKGIEYVHSRGGRLLLFLSYSLIDHESDFYRSGSGEECTVKSIWNTEVPFAETYCGEGTYRKMCNPPMPMYLSCPGSDTWQKKLAESIRACLDLGADGVLLDLGGLPPYFCYDRRHNHRKPSHSCEQKADRFKELRSVVKQYGEDKIILMEHNVDVFNQYMDIIQPGGAFASPRGNLPEMYRYTFPELILTNREFAQDEKDYRRHVNLTAALGLRYDMTVFRCCGSLSDVPNYARYLAKMNRLRAKYAPWLLRGTFRDQDGLSVQGNLKVYVFEAADHSRVLFCWNDSDEAAEGRVSLDGSDSQTVKLNAQDVCVVRMDD